MRAVIPNTLTVLRIILALSGAWALWLSWQWSQNWAAPDWLGDTRTAAQGAAVYGVIAFIIAAISDWVDGALARRWKVESQLGALLDPIADKLLVDSYLLVYVLIIGAPLNLAVPVGVIVLRDVVITLSRMTTRRPAEHMPVSPAAKLKTALAMIVTALPLIAVPAGWAASDAVLAAWVVAVWIVAAMSMMTAWRYIRPARA